ncbi:MAG: NAD(+)/NADH kinase [Paraclostridium sp.]|uniref:NAD(+)/NADH kinase n=1 Tax=Paraclostridium sp. TaxID=2023273 RepID=UPI003EE7C659
MKRTIIINSNSLDLSIKTRDVLTEKLICAGFNVIYTFDSAAELIISIGGDGSFLKTVHDFDFPEIPILGINTGHLGFFTDVYPNFIDKFIDDYKKGNFILQDIPLVQATICTKGSCIDMFAVNDVVIKGDKSRTIHLNLNVNNKDIQNFSGDGLLISTPTGSTAYNYAAGGSIVDPSLKLMQLTPLHPINTNAYRCFTSSIIFPHDALIGILPEYRFEDSLLIVVDGVEHRFERITSLSITTSDVFVKLVRLDNYEFWSRVSEKFL